MKLALYICMYAFWLIVYMLPTAVLATCLMYIAIKCRVDKCWVVVLFLCLVVAFPPMQEVGTWQKEESGQIAVGSARWQLDRFWYGYYPHYKWIGARFGPDIPGHGHSSIIGEVGSYRRISFRYEISLTYFIPECILVPFGLLMLCLTMRSSGEKNQRRSISF